MKFVELLQAIEEQGVEIMKPKNKKEQIMELNEQRKFFMRSQAKDAKKKRRELVKISHDIISNISRDIRGLRGEQEEESKIDLFG